MRCLVKELQAKIPRDLVPNDLLGFGEAADEIESNANAEEMPTNALVSVCTTAEAAEPETPANNPVSDLVLVVETSVFIPPFSATQCLATAQEESYDSLKSCGRVVTPFNRSLAAYSNANDDSIDMNDIVMSQN